MKYSKTTLMIASIVLACFGLDHTSAGSKNEFKKSLLHEIGTMHKSVAAGTEKKNPAPAPGPQPTLSATEIPSADPSAESAPKQNHQRMPSVPLESSPSLKSQSSTLHKKTSPMEYEAGESASRASRLKKAKDPLTTEEVSSSKPTPLPNSQPGFSPTEVPSSDHPVTKSGREQTLKTMPVATIESALPLRFPSSSPSAKESIVDSGGNASAAADPTLYAKDIDEILKLADEARGNLKGVQWVVSIVASGDRQNNKVVYDIKARGFDTLAESLHPAKDKGNKVLMVNGNMWFYKPGLSKPVPLARRQKLLGTAAYGDIASTNYDEDYESQPLPDDTVDGENCYVFDLKANNSKATYDRIKYWIRKKDCVGVKAEYFTVSGKKFKSATMEYENSLVMDGETRPFISKINIRDDLLGIDHTILSFTETKIGRIPDYVFNINLMRR